MLKVPRAGKSGGATSPFVVFSQGKPLLATDVALETPEMKVLLGYGKGAFNAHSLFLPKSSHGVQASGPARR
jgi:hypothetical protein